MSTAPPLDTVVSSVEFEEKAIFFVDNDGLAHVGYRSDGPRRVQSTSL